MWGEKKSDDIGTPTLFREEEGPTSSESTAQEMSKDN